jgi:ketosteroid isomerase-like protein
MQADHKTEAEILAAMNEMAAAYASRSTRRLAAVIAPDPDVVMYGTGLDEKRLGRDGILTQAQRDWSQTDSASFRIDWHAISAAGPVAWIAADIAFVLVAGGQSMELLGRLTSVLEKRGDTWLIVQAHYSFPAAGQQEGESFPAE